MTEREERIPNYIDYPYDVFIKLRLEFLLICQDEIEAKVMRIIEKAIEDKRKNLYRILVNKTPKGEEVRLPEQIWVAISHTFFLDRLYGTVQSENTLKAALKSLADKKLILRRAGGNRPYDAQEYTLNKPLIQEKLAELPLLDELNVMSMMKQPRKPRKPRKTVESGYQTLIPSNFDTLDNETEGQTLIPQSINDCPPGVSKFDTNEGQSLIPLPRDTDSNLDNTQRENALSSIDETRTLSSSNSSSSITDEAIPSQAPSSEQREATAPLTAENGTTAPALPEFASQREEEHVPPTKQAESPIVNEDTGKSSSGKGNKGSQANNAAKKPTPGADEKALRKQVQQWIDEKRGYRLYGSGTKEQIFSEQNAVNMFALKLLNEQQGNHEEGCTWDELDYLWKVVRTKDPYWSKDENRSRVGGYALQQQFATVVLGKYRPAKLKQMRDQNAAQGATQTGTNMASAVQEHRQLSDLERRNAELRAKYGQKQIS